MSPRVASLPNPVMNIDSGAARTSGGVSVPHSLRGVGDADPATPCDDETINILIVDDEPRTLTVLESILGDCGYRLIRAQTVDQALLALVVEEFALLILDIRMPGMTGFELAQLIKSRKRTSLIPIIFLTAYYNEDQHVLAGYNPGAVDYLHKPVNPVILRSKVAVFAELHRKNRECGMANHVLLAEVTERRRAENRLRELNETLEQKVTERTAALVVTNDALNEAVTLARKASLAKSDFLSSMSHELRTPLNAILGFAQLLDVAPSLPTAAQKRSISQIIDAGWYLLELINELLDLSLIESGKLSLSMEPISLSEVMNDCQIMIESDALKRDVHTIFRKLQSPYFVQGDHTRVKQVLVNLLSNAIKYNKVGGTIEVDCYRSTPGRVRIAVKDTGEGLAPDQCAQLFQPFNRLGQETGSVEGTGIGLALCKRLVELMGGAIGVESTVGEGCVFWFELDMVAESALTVTCTPPALPI